MAGENKNREKYGVISQNPPLYSGHNNSELTLLVKLAITRPTDGTLLFYKKMGVPPKPFRVIENVWKFLMFISRPWKRNFHETTSIFADIYVHIYIHTNMTTPYI